MRVEGKYANDDAEAGNNSPHDGNRQILPFAGIQPFSSRLQPFFILFKFHNGLRAVNCDVGLLVNFASTKVNSIALSASHPVYLMLSGLTPKD
jgi:hypothetical protein